MRNLATVWLALGLLLGSGFSIAVAMAQDSSVADLLPESVALDSAACFEIDDEGVFDFPSLVERFSEMPNAATHLKALGWEGGAYRQFECDAAPTGRVNWVEVGVHRFKDSASAVDNTGQVVGLA